MMRQKNKPEQPLTLQSLERSALWHLSRRALSVSQLRVLLDKKAKRAAAEHGLHPEAQGWIESLLVRLQGSLLLDDARVAAARASSLRHGGRSARLIEMKLRAKGIDQATARAAVERIDEGTDEPELVAAREFVRRRRLADKDGRKALAALARQGFSFAIARRALTADGE